MYNEKSDANAYLPKKKTKNDEYNDKSKLNTTLLTMKTNNNVSYNKNSGINNKLPNKIIKVIHNIIGKSVTNSNCTKINNNRNDGYNDKSDNGIKFLNNNHYILIQTIYTI